ncbi:MAG: geranylgeranyl reductase family protein [Chthoniobacterales bacterium]|nr:geranylgeranyl reductase family protein [Chthoniobacterales bacterium]
MLRGQMVCTGVVRARYTCGIVEGFDVAIVGGGPAGACCAAFCARAGLRTLVLERERFPREKVCGDCINPAAEPVFERLQIAERLRTLPHGKLQRIDFVAIGGRTVSVELPEGAEIAVKRSLFDHLLVTRAAELGAIVSEETTVTAITPPAGSSQHWRITAGRVNHAARILVAADGRNSTVARLLGLLPKFQHERIGLQAHVPLPTDFGERVVLQFRREGYSGQAPIGNAELNLCLVSNAAGIKSLRAWSEKEFKLSREQTWRTITPLRRTALRPAQNRLFLVGDAARVVEPFTGEGIFYALRSGEIAAASIATLVNGADALATAQTYAAAHEQLYRGRLWVNRLARTAVLSPRITSALLRTSLLPRSLLRVLTAKIVS